MYSTAKTAATAAMALAAATLTTAHPAKKLDYRGHCPAVVGTFNISASAVYSENIDFDSIHCKIYAGEVYKASVLKYDPYTGEHEEILIPGISGNESFHVDGIDFDHRTGAIYISASSSAPFLHSDLSPKWDNFLVKYDTFTESIVYIADTASATAEISAIAGENTNGFQDMAEDTKGNSYYVESFGSGIIKVNPKGEASVFLTQPKSQQSDPPVLGYSGVVGINDMLVLAKNDKGTLITIDTTSATPSETTIALSGEPIDTPVNCDGMIAPARYCDQIILCSEDFPGAILVYASSDNWVSAKYIGNVLDDSPLVVGESPTATVQIADNVFISNFRFVPEAPEVPVTEFPLIDITSQVDALYTAAGFTL